MSHDQAAFVQTVKEIQAVANAQTCAFLVRNSPLEFRDNDDVIFRVPGVFNCVINAIAYASIKKLPHAWDREFTTVFNEFRSSDTGISSLAGRPTVREILMCPNWFGDISDFVMAPDKTLLVTAERFVEIAPNFARSDIDEIGSANPILLSLLVEAIEKKDLYTILKDVLPELGMNRTFIGSTDVPTKDKTPSYHVSSERIARSHKLENLTHDTIEIAILGGYTCVADLECFFNSLCTSARFKGFLDLTNVDYSPLGLYPRLDSRTPGCLSLHEKLTGSGRRMLLDIPFTVQEQRVHYMAGYDRGWCCAVYFNPLIGLTVVLCNTTGPLDVSDMISQMGISLCAEQFVKSLSRSAN